MVPEQRDALDEIISKIRSGRMNRRTFLERAIAVGLSTSAAATLLDACGGTTNSTGGNGQTTNIVWQTENDNSGTYPALVDNYNKTNKDGVHVTWRNGPSGTGDILTIYDNTLRARSGNIDVMSIDVVYPAEFASNGWTVDLTSKWPASDRANYLPGPIKSCTYNNQIVAAPLRTDLGVLYYRKDIVSTPPATFDQLTSTAKSNASKAKYGYVWQGSQYEGLVCDFVEVLGGYGGTVLDPNNSKQVTINSPAGVQALTEMVSWVGTISPTSITTFTEEPARQAFQNGDAIFMRNWPYAYSLGNASGSKVAGKFDITAMPYGGSGTVGHSCVGGWNMAINAFSKNPDASWSFIKYMLGPDAQKQLALKGSFTPSLQSVYDDAAVKTAQPLFTKLAPILQNSLPRPVSPVYPDLSNIIQNHVHQALTKQASPADALNALQTELQALVSK
ncbi:MAG TPA: ABC transporter substrate-binding protein [Ktedonobacteraceae bacterium]|nr:ABC transporter substrate-binding protein [Ktedonobacteraceae bacterium]